MKSKRIRLSTKIRQTFQLENRLPKETKSFEWNFDPPTSIRSDLSSIYNEKCSNDEILNLEILEKMSFVGQFDRKFLICRHSKTLSNEIQLIFFDQHAVSERILLEQLQNYFHSNVSRRFLISPILIDRNPRFLYSKNEISLLERIGFVFSSISEGKLRIGAVPSWLFPLVQRRSSVIGQTIDEILSSKLNAFDSNLNRIISQTLKTIACHNAIKFNDFLSTNESKSLFDELKKCSMPFICAHGRISSALLWQFQRISSPQYEINWKELKELASIHKWMKNS